MTNNVYLMFVGIEGAQSNKYYNMFPNGNEFKVEYGRVGSTKAEKIYPMSKWHSTYKSKLRKGYKDISDLKVQDTVVKEDSGNIDFDEFYNLFSKYTGDSVKRTYLTEGATKTQMQEAQNLLNLILSLKSNGKVDDINDNLLELYKVIPRRMSDVRSHLISDVNQIQSIVQKEQDALDSMDSSNIINVSNPYKELNVDFSKGDDKDIKFIEDLLYPTIGSNRCRVHKVYNINHKTTQNKFDSWLDKQSNKSTEYLIHGTRNPNVFSILKSGLLIRPTNAAVISGAAYGNGIYHSAHTAKSLNYTGYDNDKIFFIQKVHMGNPYTYYGWYRDNKGLSRSQMNYNDLNKMGYDSLYVKPGDGLLNSEYITYKAEQTTTNYLVWMK